MQENVENSAAREQLLNETQAADILCYSVRALQNWRHRGGGPRFVKVSARSVRYRHSDLIQWIESRTVSNTSQIN
ncbi:helix-turn-helix domain-containing protein [Loktanella sp. 5RATIMAR09]|uniref:helix-turn-helix transcriptional regulator n=1 Tax=Loktanella sp. 5RATIMAR09 TaxID=1225655 RepID=UPI0009F8C091|nr:helix-turn-helix domain-containing protein [Loktanella sp. 5RATIMAR09]